MSLHLLVEQAIFDSTSFAVLSYEEVEALKKEYSELTKRIDVTANKLARESKVRDALLSFARLSAKRGQPREDPELEAGKKKCDELGAELEKYKQRAAEVRERLLMHSAGILCLTHKEGTASQRASMEYTLAHGVADPTAFDDPHLYRTADKLDGFGEGVTRGFHGAESAGATTKKPVEDEFVVERLEDFNMRIHELLQSTGGGSPRPPLRGQDGENKIHEQLALLDQNIQYIRDHPPAAPGASRAAEEFERTETLLMTLWDMIMASEEDAREQKMDRGKGYESDDEREASPEYSISVFSSKVQSMLNKLNNLRNERDTLKDRSHQQDSDMDEDMKLMQEDLKNMAGQVNQLSMLLEQRDDALVAANTKIEALTEELTGLQTALMESETVAKQTSDELEESRTAFSKKSAEFMDAMHQLDMERSQDKQKAMQANQGFQQEHNALAIANEARVEMESQLEELDRKLVAREEAMVELEIKYQDIKEDRDLTKAELEALTAENDGKLTQLDLEIVALKEEVLQATAKAQEASAQQENALRLQLEEKANEIKRMDGELEEMSRKVAELSTEVVMAKAELDIAYGSKSERAAATAQARAAALALEKANKQPQTIDPGLLAEIENLERKNNELIDEIVRLKNERAEGANNAHLEKRCKVLQKELDDMLKDFENLTKQGIEAEKERSRLESTIDSLKERVDGLETAVAEEKIGILGVQSNGPRSADPRARTGDSTTLIVLRQEFKKMMRDMRTEQAKALKVCFLPSTHDYQDYG